MLPYTAICKPHSRRRGRSCAVFVVFRRQKLSPEGTFSLLHWYISPGNTGYFLFKYPLLLFFFYFCIFLSNKIKLNIFVEFRHFKRHFGSKKSGASACAETPLFYSALVYSSTPASTSMPPTACTGPGSSPKRGTASTVANTGSHSLAADT